MVRTCVICRKTFEYERGKFGAPRKVCFDPACTKERARLRSKAYFQKHNVGQITAPLAAAPVAVVPVVEAAVPSVIPPHTHPLPVHEHAHEHPAVPHTHAERIDVSELLRKVEQLQGRVDRLQLALAADRPQGGVYRFARK